MLLAPPLYHSCCLAENTNIRGGWEGLVTHRLTSPLTPPFDEHHRSQTNGVQKGEKTRLFVSLITLTCFQALQDSLPASIFSRSSIPVYSHLDTALSALFNATWSLEPR